MDLLAFQGWASERGGRDMGADPERDRVSAEPSSGPGREQRIVRVPGSLGEPDPQQRLDGAGERDGALLSLTVVVVGLSVAFAGLLPVSTVGVDIIVAAAPPERTGAASAISETTQELGTALGIALLGSLAAAIYRGQVAHAIPTGDPRGAAEAIQDTLGGATGAADQFPTALLAIAKEAFTAGLQTAALTSAVALAGMAAVAMITLRHSRADVCMTDQTQSLRHR